MAIKLNNKVKKTNKKLGGREEAGANPGFPVLGGANLQGRQHTILPKNLKNYTKLRKFWHSKDPPLRKELCNKEAFY